MSTPSSLVVSNTTPLIALDACNQLDLLRFLYARIIVPTEVANELARGGATGLPAGLTASHLAWIEVRPLANPPSGALLARLDPGEAEVITLALEIEADLVLMDEKLGMKVVREQGLTGLGSVGVLLLAKKKGLLAEVKPHLIEMHAKGVSLSASLTKQAIILAGEIP
jgi:predicted nucleic acid-binding protein